MGRRKFTYDELEAAHERQNIELCNQRTAAAKWKKRANEYESKFHEYAFINKPPEYFYSFSGLLLFRRFYRLNGLNPMQVELIVVMSYCGVFLSKHFELYRRNYIAKGVLPVLQSLVKQGYAVKTSVPGKSWMRQRVGYVLTQRGRDLEKDYERYYNEKMAELRSGKLTRFTFEDGAYFRKVYQTRHTRRLEQGGGMLVPGEGPPIWLDQEEINRRNEKA